MKKMSNIDFFKMIARDAAHSGRLIENAHSLIPPNDNIANYGRREHNKSMDADIRRLEDRIDAVNREGQLRLDAAMAEIRGNISLILERTDSIKGDVAAARQSETQHFQWLAGLIVASVLASILAIGGFAYSAKSLWASGFSSGQTDRPAMISSPAPQSAH